MEGQYDAAGTAYGVVVSDKYAYVAGDRDGLLILRNDAPTAAPNGLPGFGVLVAIGSIMFVAYVVRKREDE